MKKLLLILSLFVAHLSKAQTIQVIESELSKAFAEIKVCAIQDRDYMLLKNANHQFEKLLLDYTSKNLETINAEFKSLRDSGLIILTSEDGNFRIYNWNPLISVGCIEYRTIFQCRANEQVFSKTFMVSLLTDQIDSDDSYTTVQQISSRDKIFYLAFSESGCNSSHFSSLGQQVKAFSIENGHLNDTVKLFKTKKEVVNHLWGSVIKVQGVYKKYERNKSMIVTDYKFEYDEVNKIVTIPFVKNYRFTNRKIRYRFTGTFFEEF